MATTTTTTTRGPASPPTSELPPVPSSPTYSYASTANPLSQYSLPLPPPPRPSHPVLNKTDVAHSHAAYDDLVASAKAYRLALASLSSAASSFGSALESCARLKEARADTLGPPAAASLSNSFNTKGSCTADGLLAASGLQHLVANHQQILSETVYRSFEVPLLHELDKWRAAADDEEEAYTRAVRAQSREIRRLEKEGLRLHRQRRRDVAGFREHLVQLTTKLDGLTALHTGHARSMLRESQETSSKILDASCSLVRAEVDIFESLAKKGWSGGGLEDVLEKGVDLLAADDGAGGGGVIGVGGGPGEGGGNKLFSVLPPKSILADSSVSDPIRGPATATSAASAAHSTGDLLADRDRYLSLAGAVVVSDARGRDNVGGVFDLNRPRGARPFSPPPQPVRLNPDGLIDESNEHGDDGGRNDDNDSRHVNDNDGNDDDGDNDEHSSRGHSYSSNHSSQATTPTEIPRRPTPPPLDPDPDPISMSLTLEPVGSGILSTAGEEEEEEDQHPWRQDLGIPAELGKPDENEPALAPGESALPYRDRKWSFGEGDVGGWREEGVGGE